MAHRSDEEALRAKLDERERELREASRELEAAREENERLRTERRKEAFADVGKALRGRGNAVGLAAAVAALLAGVGGMVGYFLLASEPAPYVPPPAVEAVPVPPGPPLPPPMPPPAAVPITVIFGARARAVSGETSVHEGDACTLRALIEPGPIMGLQNLEVSCGGQRIYGLSDEMAGMSMVDSDVRAWPGDEPGTLRYEVVLSDTGMRTGRPEAIVRTWTDEAAIYSSGLGAFRVELDVDPVSNEVPQPPGSAIAYIPGLPHHTLRTGHVVSAEPPGLEAGTPCRLAVRPSPGMGDLNSRVHIRCGTTTLYGAGTTGFAPLEGGVVDDPVMSAADGDAAIHLDLGAGTISIRDEHGGTPEHVEIALDPAPEPPADTGAETP